MITASGTLLALIIVSLGILGIILSFLVVDRKKSLISLGLAGLIIVTGLFQLGSQSFSRFRFNQRIRELQRDRSADFDQLRQQLRERAGETAPGSGQKKP